MEAFRIFVFVWAVWWVLTAVAVILTVSFIQLWNALDDGGRFVLLVTSISLVITIVTLSLGL